MTVRSIADGSIAVCNGFLGQGVDGAVQAPRTPRSCSVLCNPGVGDGPRATQLLRQRVCWESPGPAACSRGQGRPTGACGGARQFGVRTRPARPNGLDSQPRSEFLYSRVCMDHGGPEGSTEVSPQSRVASVVELVDTPDLGSGAERCGGSSPFARTYQRE